MDHLNGGEFSTTDGLNMCGGSRRGYIVLSLQNDQKVKYLRVLC